jgi:hypothetical protein
MVVQVVQVELVVQLVQLKAHPLAAGVGRDDSREA